MNKNVFYTIEYFDNLLNCPLWLACNHKDKIKNIKIIEGGKGSGWDGDGNIAVFFYWTSDINEAIQNSEANHKLFLKACEDEFKEKFSFMDYDKIKITEHERLI